MRLKVNIHGAPLILFVAVFSFYDHIVLKSNANSSNMLEKGNCTATCSSRPKPANRISDEPESVWVEFIQLALDHKPLNLGQGFPDFAAPEYLIDSLHNATSIKDPKMVLNNQYTRSFGHPRLVKALRRYYNEFRSFADLKDPNQQILVTVGAYEALFVSLMGFVNPGDEVIIIDPAFDAYAPIVKMAQGRSVYVPLRQVSQSTNGSSISSSEFQLDFEEFESKITNKTRVLVLNTPNNPLGKMYTRLELEKVAKLCIKYNILVIADEVYEQMYYAPDEHLSIALLPGMWNRTITVGSAGKTFSVTGWKIGWAMGPQELIKYAQLVHQTAIYTVATPLQESVARALENEMDKLGTGGDYWSELRSDLLRKRKRMADILARAQMQPIVPQGGYFMLANFSPLAAKNPEFFSKGMEMGEGKVNTNDYRFARWLSREKKLQGIPASAFYSKENKHLASDLIRFCFIKESSTLDKLEVVIEKGFNTGGGGGSDQEAKNSASTSGVRSKL